MTILERSANKAAPAAGQRPWSVRMADSMLRRYPIASLRWHYEDGLLIRALDQVWRQTKVAAYWQAVLAYAGRFVGEDGSIRTYRLADYNLDQVNPGKVLFPVYAATGEERYRRALESLAEQVRRQPRTQAGGFWHKLIYPYQMWLDGIYMAAPFYAEYGRVFEEPAVFDDVAHQILTIERVTRDAGSGLLYHAWDESREQPWADPETGCSPHFWGRAVGWYVMAIVDVLDVLPAGHPQSAALVAVLARTMAAVARYQEPGTGLWYQVLDQGNRPGNYLEASASCMFVYTLARGVRAGYLRPAAGPDWLAIARRGYQGLLTQCIQVDALGETNLHWTCGSAGLGGTPYRDGSYAYYIGEKIVTNDLKGAAAFILAALEMERAG